MMEPYNKDTECIKCDIPGADTAFIPEENDVPEHMKRICMNCSFEWQELPIDSNLKEGEQDV